MKLNKSISRQSASALAMTLAMGLAAVPAHAEIIQDDDVSILGELSVDGICAGENCGYPILDDTILIKDNRARIRIDDTSVGDFPANDWQLTFNDITENGDNYFSIEDLTASTIPFVIEAGAPSSSVYVNASGNIGIGTASPSVPLHVVRSTGSFLEGIQLTNNNEARISIENTNQNARYIMAVNNVSPGLFFISRSGGGGTILEVTQRNDAGGTAAVNVWGTVNATAFTSTSSRETKEAFTKLDPQEILDKVTTLPVSKWRFKDGPAVEHIGPMAEDFHDAFGLNSDNKTISMTDASGVALLAIQGLNQRLVELEKQNAELRKNLEAVLSMQKN